MAKFLGSDGLLCFISICKFESFKNPFPTITKVKPVYNNHLGDKVSTVVIDRWSIQRRPVYNEKLLIGMQLLIMYTQNADIYRYSQSK